MDTPSQIDNTGKHAPRIDIIIPYFQREVGILQRSLASISEQDYPHDSLKVIIIDDGSLLPAENELLKYPPPATLTIEIIKQPNAGPNEARNNGLDHVDSNARYIAYLDSDDSWTSDHLKRAVNALSCGYTAYFSNLIHLGADTPTFEKSGYVTPDGHPMVANDPTLREYQGDMIHQIVTANIIFMPSLVIDREALGSVRFPKAHRHGGGDYLYWLALIANGKAKFVFSTKPEVVCGTGINMWYGSGWGTDGLAKRIIDEARYRRVALNAYARNNNTKAALRNRITELQIVFCQDIIHRLRRRKNIDWESSRTFLTENPPTLGMLAAAFRNIWQWTTSRL